MNLEKATRSWIKTLKTTKMLDKKIKLKNIDYIALKTSFKMKIKLWSY